jgi:hypothetical protein
MQVSGLGAVVSAIGLILASATFFDRIASESLKRQVTETLKGKQAHFTASVPAVARFFISQSIGRLFPGNILRFRNVVVSIFISIASITFFAVLVSFVNDVGILELFDFAENDNFSTKFGAFVCMLSAALAVDVISCLQTALFLNLTVRIRSAYDMLFMAFCDLIVTINLFVFVFPIGMQVWITAKDLIGRDITIYVEQAQQAELDDRDAKDADKKPVLEAAAKYHMEAQDTSVFGYYGSNPENIKRSPASPGMVATREMATSELVDRFFKALGARPQSRKGLIPNPGDDEDGFSVLFQSMYDEKAFSYATVHLSKHLTFFGGQALYGFLFAKAHVVQDAFSAVVSLRVIEMRTNDALISLGRRVEYVKVPHKIARGFFISCDGVDRFVNEIPDLTSCKKVGLFNSGAVLSHVYEWTHLMSPFLTAVPVSLFVITSLFLTISFYVSLTLALLSNRLGRLSLHLAFVREWVAVEKNPFLISALILLIVVSPFIAAALVVNVYLFHLTPLIG